MHRPQKTQHGNKLCHLRCGASTCDIFCLHVLKGIGAGSRTRNGQCAPPEKQHARIWAKDAQASSLQFQE